MPLNEIGQQIEKSIKFNKRVKMSQESAEKCVRTGIYVEKILRLMLQQKRSCWLSTNILLDIRESWQQEDQQEIKFPK